MADQVVKKRRKSHLKKIRIRGKICRGEHIDALNLRPEIGELDFRKAIALQLIPKQQVIWDAPRNGPEMGSLISQRELRVAKEFLQMQRVKQMCFLRKKKKDWGNVEKNQNTLHDNFKRYNTMLRENRDKVDRAKKKALEEWDKQQDLIIEVNTLRKSLEYYKQNKQLMKQQIAIYKMYEIFLQKIVDSSSKFDTIEDASNMYEALVTARETIAIRQKEGDVLMSNLTQDMTNLINEKNSGILEINSILKTLDFDYHKAKQNTHYWEDIISKIKTIVLEKISEIYQIKQMIWDLYVLCCQLSEKVPELDKKDMEQQLAVLSDHINLQKTVLKRARQRQMEIEKRRKSHAHKSTG